MDNWLIFVGYVTPIIIILCGVGILLRIIYITHLSYKAKIERDEKFIEHDWNRNEIWQSYDGQRRKIRDLEDSHVANIIDFLQQSRPNATKLIETMQTELEIRGLKQEFADRAQIPYKNQYGKWEIWNFFYNKPMEIEA